MIYSPLGKSPSGRRLQRIQNSPNYGNGAFQNIHETPQLAKGYNFGKVMFDFLFRKPKGLKPPKPITFLKTDLQALPVETDLLVWFGHSSYYLQFSGKRFLVDPVFSNSASPIPQTNKPFKGSNHYAVEDLPNIDYLLISHDHYDHLDYKTIKRLKPKVKQIITGLGVGSHFEAWGYPAESVVELDWNETLELENDITLNTTSARHFSGRGFKRNNTLWLSFILQTENYNLFLGGDSGYDTHFKEIGNKFGPFDLAILENGQYNLAWHYIHMLPEEVLQAAQDLRAKQLFPVHSAKFALALHAWDEPLNKIYELNKSINFPLVTPCIGEPVQLDHFPQQFSQWWKDI
ncbi:MULTISPECIES: MBL fold metallo-hydrolase [Aequorivita]|uniref:MBL fold metallo-hydrolase n=1 Tax=Aequorivita iocasae TaxID=2803865 RepID=A0ABX7DWZ1_9FLAO|nr:MULTISPECIES: MBL fold metallo-hydrolase [Aequorivita]QQX78092.1 MBL fold metallo-hydrolase [Aequorivita iocasae]UCA57601.1 MBL fold metallo-hydrolase [Aequorivita sp. F7]